MVRYVIENECFPLFISSVKLLADSAGGTQITGRPIDLLYVQSTDKNLLVPVGGAIVAGFDAALVAEVAKTYPGKSMIVIWAPESCFLLMFANSARSSCLSVECLRCLFFV